MHKLTSNDFIERSNKIHKGKYDYSLVEYKNNSTKVKIICPDHGIYDQLPNHHIKKHGCSRCGGSFKITTEEFIEKAVKVHGDRYNYSLVKYKNANTKVKIICPDHGIYEQSSIHHLNRGQGCPICNSSKLTTKEFCDRSSKIHNNKYDYSLVKYKNNHTKVKIICPDHKIFLQSPNMHLLGHGCSRCGIEFMTLTTDEFIEISKMAHGNKYDYSLVKYKNNHTKVKIICPIHNIFYQSPRQHMKGSICLQCENVSRASNIEEFIKKALNLHGDRYDYSEIKYKNNYTKVKIICPDHNCFYQSPNSHLSNHGCPQCAREKFRSDNEKYCCELLEKMYPNLKIIPNDREILVGKSPSGFNLEIDIRICDKNYNDLLYVEWNGIYWHRDKNKKLHDRIKKDILKNMLLQIEDPEHYFNKEFVESIIHEQIIPILGPPKEFVEYEDISSYFSA